MFTADGAWFGGFYELAIEVGPPSDERSQAALAALWRNSDRDGCYLDRSCEPREQTRVPPDLKGDSSHLLAHPRLGNTSLAVVYVLDYPDSVQRPSGAIVTVRLHA